MTQKTNRPPHFTSPAHAILPINRLAALCLFLIFLFSFSYEAKSQTDFAPGEIMFTGYKSDDADAFSIVLLAPVVSGTVIYITDRGWSNTTGYRLDNNGEGTISYTFTTDYPCGTEIFFHDVNGANDWAATDAYGIAMGTVVIQATSQDPDGMELGTNGDQLSIYQLPEPTSGSQGSFVSMIQMDNNFAAPLDNDDESELPTGLPADAIVRFNSEVDNAKYDCTPYTDTPAALKAAISNDNGSGGLIADGSNNWRESDPNSITVGPCFFCCGSTPPIAGPTISAPFEVGTGTQFTITITGTLASGSSWQLFTAGCGIGSPLQTTMSNSFTVTAPATEGFVTYYVNSSQAVDCNGLCGIVTISVCSNPNNQNLCTSCSANPAVCGDCLLQYPVDNPPMDSGCYALKVVFVLDESGSIQGNQNNVRDAVLAFLNSLNGQDAQVALIEFNDLARVVNTYQVSDQNYIIAVTGYFNGIPLNGQTYNPNGGTNWHDAMKKVDAMAPPDLVIFLTDGEPTCWTQANGNPSCCNGGTADIVNPVKLANKVKGEGTHMFMYGVGGNVNTTNLEYMSGYDEYVSGTNTLATADYSIGGFANLANDLANFINELCRVDIEVSKTVLGPVCADTVIFQFIIYNLSDQSATNLVYATDTLPAGYVMLHYWSHDITNKVCPFIFACDPPLGPNAFQWVAQPIPPLSSDTIFISATVLPGGPYTNYFHAHADNSDYAADTLPSSAIVQNVGPSITCPANITIACGSSTLPAATGNPTASDPDGPTPTLTYTDSNAGGSCPVTSVITRHWTATDGCGSTATCNQIITLKDLVPPVITCPANITVTCGSNTLPVATGTATGVDVCDPTVAISYADMTVAGGCPAEYTINRTWMATDDCLNTSTCVQHIFIDDNQGPVMMCSNILISCAASTLPSNTGYPTVTNNCGGSSTFTYTDVYVFQPTNPQCSIQRTWTATDDCSNSATCIQIITIKDNTGPTIFCPANVTISCSVNTTPDITGMATATDNCLPAPTMSYSDAVTISPTCPQSKTIARTWVADDQCDNTSTCVQTISVVDNLAPSITCPANITVQCNSSTLPATTGSPTSIDNCDATPTITFTDVTTAGSCPQKFTITRTWKSQDDCGNFNTCIQSIFVNDNIGPTLTCPANITILCTASTLPANTGTATATDNCSGAPVITSTDATVAGGCPQGYMITRTWKGTDACGNINTCNQTISITDNVAPTITCPANVTILCSASTLPANTGNPTSTDNCDASPIITFTDAITGSPCPQAYSIVRTWKSTDHCGNFNTCTQSIAVTDNVAPTINCPANVTIQCNTSTLPASTGNPTSIDNCDATPTITFTDVTVASPTCPQEYTITRTWKSQDDCGNFNTCNQTIVIDDSTNPVITCPPNITIQCTAGTLPENTGSPTSIDNCDATPTITFTDVTTAGSCPQKLTITRTWKSTDDCANFSTCNQTISIIDNVAPAITCPANITVLCTAVTLPVNTGTATGTDNCDPSADITYTDVTVAGGCPQEYTITRTWKAQDDCGNFNTCNQIIFVDDNAAPAITCPPDLTILCSASTSPENTGTATGTDNCDATPTITHSDVIAAGSCPQKYTITRTWKAQDDCGNFNTCNQSIVVDDNSGPMITCPADMTIECTVSTLPASTGTATASDNCDATPTITFTDVTTAGACPQTYTITRTWKAQDDCGNFNTCNQTIQVHDTTAPAITCPANITIQCTASTLPENTGTATSSDNCDATPAITFTDVTAAGSCSQKYTITRTWMSTDDCNNLSTCNQTITVTDDIGPVITCPANLTIACTVSTFPANTGTATSTDNCDASPIVTYADVTTASPSCPQQYSIARTWVATDICGNSTTCVQSLVIIDNTSPEITCPPDITILCTASTLPTNTGQATTTDNCDPAPDVEYFDITMSVPGSDGYQIQRLWTATDACGNNATCTQHILVNNPLDPEILGDPFDTICSGQTVIFEAVNQGISPITYEWSFGSGSNPSTATGIGPHTVTYTYNTINGSTGAWVILTVTTPGCPPVTDTVANVHVNALPTSAITASPGNPCIFGPKTFQPTAAQVPGFTYLWNFGAGAVPPTANGYGPYTIEYSTPGSKTVKLTVWTNEAGASCADSSTVTFTVNTCPGSITGRVFLDTQTTDTVGIANVTVRLYADQNLDGLADTTAFVRTVSTNASGKYSMASITPGYYVIIETQPASYFSLWEDDTSEDYDSLSNIVPNDNIIPVTVESSELDTRNFFVEVVSPGIISGYVFDDFNGDQIPQSAEGIAGVTINLHTDNDANGVADGAAVATAITNSIGYYTIGGMVVGNYVLAEVQPGGYNSVIDIDPTNDGDVVPNTNMMNDTLPLTLTNAEVDAENFFIEATPCNQYVTTTEDNVPGSLRFAIQCAQNWDTIFFSPALANQTIHINAGHIEINKNLYIYSEINPTVMLKSDGSGAFKIYANNAIEFKGINFTSGTSGPLGSEFENYGHLTLWNCQIFKNPMQNPNDFMIYNHDPGDITVKGTFQLHNY